MRTADRHSPPDCVTSLLDIIPDAAYFIDTAGRVQYANEAAARHEAGAISVGADLARLPLTDSDGTALPYESSPFYRSAEQGETCHAVDLRIASTGAPAQALRVSSTPVREEGALRGALIIVQPLDPLALLEPDLAQRNAALQALNDLAARLLRINTTQEVYETALDGILAIMDARQGAINLADDTRREFHLTTHRGYTAATRRTTDRMPYDLPSAHNTVRESGEIVIIHPDRAGRLGQQVLASQGVQTAVLLPLFRGEQVIGVLSYLLDEYRECTPLEREILRTAATYVGAALERAQLYEAAEAERTRLARILEHLPVGVLIGEGAPDPQTIRFTFSNETVRHQYSRSVVAPGAGHETFTIVHPDGRPYADAELPLQATLWTGQPAPEQELVFRYQDGAERVFLADAALLQTGAATREAIVVTQEITARKQVEAALRDSERQFRAVFDNTHDVLLLCDDEGRYVNVNPAACTLFGQDREALLGHKIAEFAGYPAALEVVGQRWQQFLDAGHDQGEFRVRRPDGTHRDFEYTATAHVLPGLHLAAGRDITEPKRLAEQVRHQAAALQSEYDRLAAIISQVDVALAMVDAAGRFTLVNDAWEQFSGYSREQALGRRHDEVSDPESGAQAHAVVMQVLAGGEPVEMREYPYRDAHHPEGMYIDGAITPMRAPDGTITGALITSVDVTEKVQARQAVEAERARLTQILEQIPVGIFIAEGEAAERTMRWKFVNQAGQQQLAAPSVTPGPVSETFTILHPDGSIYREEDLPIQRSLWDDAPAREQEMVFRYHDGAERSFLATTASLGEDQGTREVIEVMLDITARKRAEAALRQSEERFAKAFHSNPDPLNITRLADDLVLDVNARWLEITGYTREEVVGHTVLGLNLWVHPAERAQIGQLLYEQGAAHEVAIDFRMKSGVERHCLLSVELIELEGETCALSMVHDITERKRLEAQVQQQAATIQEEHERLATLVANINVALALLDEAGRLVLVNDAWLRNSPYTREDVLGRRPADLFDQPGLQNIQATIDQVLASGEPVQIREWHFPDSGSGLYIDGSVQPTRGPDGAITGVLTAAVDVTEKVLIRQQIEAQRTLLETIFESTPVGIILFDREMRILDLNAEYAYHANLDPHRVRGRTLYEIAPDTRQRAPIHQRVLDGEVVDQDAVAYPYRDGTLHYHDILYRPVRGPGGTISGILSATSDVTEKVRAQQQIEAQRALLETIVASLPVGIAYFDQEMRYVNMNSAWALFTGLDPAKAIGQPYYAQLPPAVQWPALHPRMLAGEVFDQENVPHAGPDGTPHYYDVRYRPVRDAGGAVTGLLTTSVDVTEKVLGQEEIENQRALLETIIEANPVGMAFFDRDLRLLNGNAAWAAIVGLDPAKARGRLIYKLVPAMREQAAAHQQALAGEDVDLFNVPFQPPGEAEMHYYDLRYRPVHDVDNAITGLLIAAIDVTERHELDRQKDDFIALASHELKTPLTAIKGYAQTALRTVRDLGDERLIRTLRIIEDQSNRLTRLINELLDVSLIEGGSLAFYQEPFDLRQMVDEVVNNLQLTAAGFAIDLHLPTTPTPVSGDRQRLEQVVTNLVQNAIKYSGASRHVDVTMTRAGAEVITAVRDFGVGIPTEQQGRVFERFFRASNVSARHYSGLGLGLFISAGIVARHGGRIWVESAEGHGSTFTFALPLLSDEP